MKLINLLIVVFITIFTTNTYGQGQPKYVEEGTISIDGSSSDWSGVTGILSDFGAKSPSSDFVDVKATKMAYSKSHFYFSIDTNVQLGSWKPKQNTSAFQIYFDVDAEQATGNTKMKAYDIAAIMGYEYRIEVSVLKSNSVQAKLYTKMNNFNKEESSWKASENFKTSGSTMEFKIPLDLLKITASGKKRVRFLFAEYANSKSAEGYKKVVYPLDFSAANKPAVEKEAASSESSGGFGIWHLMVITIWIVAMLCSFAIAPKAGLSTGVALVNIIPFFGQLAFLFILAFNKWPLHKDYESLENKIRELESQDQY